MIRKEYFITGDVVYYFLQSSVDGHGSYLQTTVVSCNHLGKYINVVQDSVCILVPKGKGTPWNKFPSIEPRFINDAACKLQHDYKWVNPGTLLKDSRTCSYEAVELLYPYPAPIKGRDGLYSIPILNFK